MNEKQKELEQQLIEQAKASIEHPDAQVINEVAMPGVTIYVNDK